MGCPGAWHNGRAGLSEAHVDGRRMTRRTGRGRRRPARVRSPPPPTVGVRWPNVPTARSRCQRDVFPICRGVRFASPSNAGGPFSPLRSMRHGRSALTLSLQLPDPRSCALRATHRSSARLPTNARIKGPLSDIPTTDAASHRYPINSCSLHRSPGPPDDLGNAPTCGPRRM
jgi:hypothetical protein